MPNGTRCFAVDHAAASSRGFSTPDACLRIASSDWRITAGRTLIAHRSRTFLIWRRSAKEYSAAGVTRPFRSQLINWRGVIRRILSKSARLYTVMLNAYAAPRRASATIIVKLREQTQLQIV